MQIRLFFLVGLSLFQSSLLVGQVPAPTIATLASQNFEESLQDRFDRLVARPLQIAWFRSAEALNELKASDVKPICVFLNAAFDEHRAKFLALWKDFYRRNPTGNEEFVFFLKSGSAYYDFLGGKGGLGAVALGNSYLARTPFFPDDVGNVPKSFLRSEANFHSSGVLVMGSIAVCPNGQEVRFSRVLPYCTLRRTPEQIVRKAGGGTVRVLDHQVCDSGYNCHAHAYTRDLKIGTRSLYPKGFLSGVPGEFGSRIPLEAVLQSHYTLVGAPLTRDEVLRDIHSPSDFVRNHDLRDGDRISLKKQNHYVHSAILRIRGTQILFEQKLGAAELVEGDLWFTFHYYDTTASPITDLVIYRPN